MISSKIKSLEIYGETKCERNPAMLKKSSKGGKVSGKNDTQDNYGGVKMIFMILTIMVMTVLMTLLIVS